MLYSADSRHGISCWGCSLLQVSPYVYFRPRNFLLWSARNILISRIFYHQLRTSINIKPHYQLFYVWISLVISSLSLFPPPWVSYSALSHLAKIRKWNSLHLWLHRFLDCLPSQTNSDRGKFYFWVWVAMMFIWRISRKDIIFWL